MNKKKSLLLALTAIVIVLILWGYKKETNRLQRYQADFTGVFDTAVTIIGYAPSKGDFMEAANYAQARLTELHQYYDIYNTYDGVQNLKTINDQAGIAPVTVSQEIMDLLLLSKEAHEKTQGKLNIAMGSVLRLWHDYREKANIAPRQAALPPMADLLLAAGHMNIDNIIIDETNHTVFLADPDMVIDAGAIAKGYAAEIVAQELKGKGYHSVILSLGGNIRAMDKPPDKDTWTIGVQNPDLDIDGSQNILDTIQANNISVVSSGDYQRYFVVDDETYHHIIDPVTLMPAGYYKQVTVLMENSAWADIYSTALFILPYEDGKALIEEAGGQALWIFPNGMIKATDGYPG